jgi:glutathione S-transferase
MLELYTSEPNTFFLKPLIALGEKRATFTLHYFDAGRLEQFAPHLPASTESRLHLEREGPMLVHDGTIIVSTFFMLEYIAEALPGPALMPRAACETYRTRAWGQFLGVQLGSIVPALGCAKYLRARLAQLDAAALAAQVASIEPVERRAGWQALLDGSDGDNALAAQRNRLRMPVARVEQALGDGPWLRGTGVFDRRYRRLRDAQRAPGPRARCREPGGNPASARVSGADRAAALGARRARHLSLWTSRRALRTGRRGPSLGLAAAPTARTPRRPPASGF